MVDNKKIEKTIRDSKKRVEEIKHRFETAVERLNESEQRMWVALR